MKNTYLLAALALSVAACTCGRGHPGGKHPSLTEEQKTCLKGQGLTDADFEPGKKHDKADMTPESKELRKKAFDACGIKRPEKGPRQDGKSK
jgi:hypothetical protein